MRILRVHTDDEFLREQLDILDNRCFPHDALEEKEGDWWIAEEDGHYLGLVGGRYQHKYYRLLRIGVIKEARGKGYAKRLVRCLLKHARKQGYLQVRTYTHWQNLASINTLIKCGFRVRDTSKVDDIYFLNWYCNL